VATTTGPVLRGDESDLFRLHHADLLTAVRRAVRASDALIEDACGFAWEQLMACQPERQETLFSWLRTVAVREAWRLSSVERRPAHWEQGRADGDSGPERIEDRGPSLDRQLEARCALERVGELPPRQRHLFALQVAGLSYQEVAAVTGDSVRTVDRQLRRAHAEVRASDL